MSASEFAFAGAALLDPAAERLLALGGAPARLCDTLTRSGPDLETEYVRLFLSPDGAPCPPWQSAHEGERRLMGEAHASALRWYSTFGAAPRCESEPADHAGLLLMFYAQMIAAGAEAAELSAFAARHLSWLPGFASTVAAEARHSFYRQLGEWIVQLIAGLPTCGEAPARTVRDF